MKVIYAPEWAKASVDTNSKELKVSLSENTTGHLRADYIKYQVAAVTDSFIVKQFDFDKDIAGEYVFAYYDFNEDTKLELQTVRATLSRTELAIPEMGLVFPVSINEETGSVETRSSQYLGKFGKYYIYDTFLDTEFLAIWVQSLVFFLLPSSLASSMELTDSLAVPLIPSITRRANSLP